MQQIGNQRQHLQLPGLCKRCQDMHTSQPLGNKRCTASKGSHASIALHCSTHDASGSCGRAP